MNKRLKLLSVSNLYAKRSLPLPLGDGVFRNVLGGYSQLIPMGGIWLVHGDEKQGKTTLCLLLADYLSKTRKVLYVQSEQSSDRKDIDRVFIEAMHNVGISQDNRNLSFLGDIDGVELEDILNRKRSADVVFIDNITFAGWVDTAAVRKLSRKFKNKTFVYVAHNDQRGDPNGSTGKAIKRLANTVFVVNALRCNVVGRGNWGGQLNINNETGKIMYGE